MDSILNASDYTILIVDDHPQIIDLVSIYLRHRGLHVLTSSDGIEALSILRSKVIHLLILDIMLPGMDGWEICKQIREFNDLPIIMVTAKGESENKLLGFGLGADDYIVKPFDPNELVARVLSQLRRTYLSSRPVLPNKLIKYGNLKIDTVGHEVTIGDEVIDLTPREYRLLISFVDHPNQVLSRQQLLDLVWGEEFYGEDRAVDVLVKRLRNKLSEETEPWEIETVRGSGYKFAVKVSGR